MTKNKVLKQQAKAQLGNCIFAKNWLLMVVVGIIVVAASSIATTITGFIGGIGGIIIAGAVTYGLARITTNLAKGAEKVNFKDLLAGFTDGFFKIFLLEFMAGIFVMLWSLLFLIPGIVKTYSYAMAPYIMQDDPSKGWNQCITESRQMMKGHKAQLFWLDISFIGWDIVCLFTFGLGGWFLNPYKRQARANFYLAVKEAQD